MQKGEPRSSVRLPSYSASLFFFFAAYETLIDPLRRRGYDSSVDFDDSIPDADQGKTAGTDTKSCRPFATIPTVK